MDTLAGRIERNGIEGELLVNGQKMPTNFNRLTGYVNQDDVVMESLTVRENITFSANLRRSFKSSDERESMVNRVIQELGLTACADTQIGTTLKRGVSGGERRRTSIGMELIISPSVLFLDEPTTGLDSSTALAVMNSLHDLSLKNTTVVFTVHQPRYSIFKLFDQLTLLSAGQCIYHGPSNETIQFFGSLGYVIEEHDNPTDFYLDIINSESSAIRFRRNTGIETGSNKDKSDSTALAEHLSTCYRSSSWYRRGLKDIDFATSASNKKYENGKDESYCRAEYAVSWVFQFYYVLKRIFLDLFRNPRKLQIKIAIRIGTGLFIGSLYFGITAAYPLGIENRRGLLTFIAMNCLFSSAMTVDAFIAERPLIIHECASGYYKVSAYFLAKIVAEILTLHVIPQLIFSVIVYFMTGLRSGGFGIFYFMMMVLSLSSSSVAWFVGSCVNSVVTGQILVSITSLAMTLISGSFTNLEQSQLIFKILQYVSLAYHSIMTMYVNEFKDLILYEYNGTQVSEIFPDAGNEFLESQGISLTSNWELWRGYVALAAICVSLGSAAYVQLLRIKKLK